MKKRLAVHRGILLGILIGYLCFLALSFYYGDKFHVQPGFSITKNDGRQYDSMSDYILENKKLYPAYYETYHSSYFFMGYNLLIATIKGIFGNYWKIAYSMLSGIIIYILALFSAKVFSRKNNYLLILLVSMVFIITNRYLNNYSRTLLPDIIFAAGTGLTFLFLVRGIQKDNLRHILGATLISVIMLSFRPNAIFLVIFSVVLFLTHLLPKRFQRIAVPVAPLLAGLIIYVFSTGLTAYLVKNFEKLDSFPELPRKMFSQVLENNYLGDNIFHDTHYGTWIVNFPYQHWIYNDGSFTSILKSTLRRIPKVFDISIPVYNDLHNLVRFLYYGTLYLFFLAFLFYSFRVRVQKPEYLLMASLFFGYLFAFVSVSHIELRYILTFDVMIILCSSFMVYKTIKFVLSQRKNE